MRLYQFLEANFLWAYHQVPLETKDVKKNRNHHFFELFKKMKMPFGFKNVAQTSQHFIGSVLRELPLFTLPI